MSGACESMFVWAKNLVRVLIINNHYILCTSSGIVKYSNTILIVGGEDDKSWMAGLCWLKEENGRQTWVEGQELPTVMSTFGCVVASIQHDSYK